MVDGFTKAALGQDCPLVFRDLYGNMSRTSPHHGLVWGHYHLHVLTGTICARDELPGRCDLLILFDTKAEGRHPDIPPPQEYMCFSLCQCLLHLADLGNHPRSLKEKQITFFIFPGTHPDKQTQSLRDGARISALLTASHVILMQLVCGPPAGELLLSVKVLCQSGASLGAQWQKFCLQCRRRRFNPWVGKKRNGNPLQYSCFEKSMDRGA